MSRIFAFVLFFISTNALGQAEVRDDYGKLVRLDKEAHRIVSLAPHLTELLYDAGAGGRVVGAVQYSDYPPAARALPRVGSDAGIDLEAVLALHPDLVVAWPNAGSARSVDRLEALGIPVFRSEPRALEDIARTLERLGTLAGTRQAAGRAAASFRARVRRLRERYSKRPTVRVFYEVWNRPLQTVNGRHVISKVMRLCGGENVFADLPTIAPLIDREAVLRANPEVIVASGPGAERPEWLDDWKAFPGLAAAAKGQLYFIPGDLIERHTRRLLDGAERLCRILEEARTPR